MQTQLLTDHYMKCSLQPGQSNTPQHKGGQDKEFRETSRPTVESTQKQNKTTTEQIDLF